MRPTWRELEDMLDQAQGEGCVRYRKQVLQGVAELAVASPRAKGRMKIRVEEFRNVLNGVPGDDEVEVAGPWFCEVVTLALDVPPS